MTKYTILFFVIFTFFKCKISYSQEFTIEKNISFLSHDSLQGRLTGSSFEKISATYISKVFQHYNLTPAFENSFYQNFSFSYNPNPHDTEIVNVINLNGVNVAGYLDNKSNKTIIIGAHFDHLGKNEYNQSLSPNSIGEIHNGADDNASGVAGVLELAKIYSTNQVIENFNFVFVCFSGEELGLIGSKASVPVLKEKFKPSLMINMDMIGRMDSLKNLYIGGVGTSKVFDKIISKNKPSTFKLTIDSSGIGPSDHTSFYLDSIPVLFFFTGSHQDYHKPSDDIDFINFNDLNTIIDYINHIIIDLSNEKEIPFKSSGNIARGKSTFKITLGLLPSYSFTGKGLFIDGVTDGKMASKIGLKKGDVIIAMNNYKINNIYDYMDCLSNLDYGDKLKIKFIRKNETLNRKIKLINIKYHE